MKRFIFLLLFAAAFLDRSFAVDVTVNASLRLPPDLRQIFDAFRAGNSPPQNRLREIGSSLVRTFIPLTAFPYIDSYQLDVVRGVYPNFTYYFDLPDTDWIEPILAQGGQVNLGYCYMPQALGSGAKGPPANYDAWEEFNYQWALHFNNKYGITYFEIWNEPDFGEFFSGSQSDYFKMYEYAVKGIRRAVPQAKVGGPALAGDMNWVAPFLDFIIANKLPVNFISYHAQDNGYNDSEYYQRYQSIVNALQARGMDSVEVHLNEFSYEISPATGSSYDRSQCAAWYAGTFKHILMNMPRLARFNKTIIDNGSGDGRWENNGLIDYDGTPKAKFNVFKMYAMMPFSGVSCQISDSLGGMAAVGDSSLGLMLWNKNNSSAALNLIINNLPFDADSIQIFLIDAEHSSYFDNPASAELEKVENKAISDSIFSEQRQLSGYSVILYLLKGHKKSTTIAEKKDLLPVRLGLKNYPNPFNSETSIEFELAESGRFALNIFDLRGEKIAELMNGYFAAGQHRLRWDGRNQIGDSLPSGIYFASLQFAGREQSTIKLILLK